jgi:hypothetical protein
MSRHGQAERDENECRKQMTPSERVSLGRALEELERPKARDRMAQAPGQPQGIKVSSVRTNGGEPFDVREVVAPAVGMSTATYSRAKQIVTAAEQGDPERLSEAGRGAAPGRTFHLSVARTRSLTRSTSARSLRRLSGCRPRRTRVRGRLA